MKFSWIKRSEKFTVFFFVIGELIFYGWQYSDRLCSYAKLKFFIHFHHMKFEYEFYYANCVMAVVPLGSVTLQNWYN